MVKWTKNQIKLFCVRSTSAELSLLIIVIPTSLSFVRPRYLSNESILQKLTQQHTHIVWFQKISTPPMEGIGFSRGRGVTIGKYFQRVLVAHKRVTKKKHKNLP